MFNCVKCILFLLILQVHKLKSDELIGCDNIEDFQDFTNREPLDLDFDGDIKRFSNVKIASIVPQQKILYINARIEETDDHIDLVIYTTENFKQYSYEQSATSIALNVIFECADDTRRNLFFYQPLKEGNYYEPMFTKAEYRFVLPTPLYKGFELTQFEDIVASDYDLTGSQIQFSSTDSINFQISIGTLRHDVQKSFASLKLISIVLSLKDDIEFSIIATDSGNPPRSSISRVIITGDLTNSLPPIPRFVKTVVYEQLTDSLQLPELEIELDPYTYNTDVSFKKLSDDENIFKITNEGNVVYVNLNRKLDKNFIKGKQCLIFDIEASNSKIQETGRTAVLILFPEKSEIQFKQQLYEGKLFAKTNTLELDDCVLDLNGGDSESLKLELEGENSHLFDKTHTEDVVKLSLKLDQGVSTWTDINYFVLKLLARVDQDEVSTNIIIEIFRPTLAFQNAAYTGFINAEGVLELAPLLLLTNEGSTDDVEVKLLRGDTGHFSFTKTGNEIVFSLKKNLIDENDLKDKNFLSLEVEAVEPSTGVRTSCVIFIENSLIINVLQFEKNIYDGRINTDAKLYVETIVLYKDSYNDDIEFSLLGRDAKYLTFQKDQNILKLSLKEGFNISEHSEATSLWVEIKAFCYRDNLAASAVVIIDIDQETAPEFERPNYIGELSEDNVLNLASLVLKPSTWKKYTTIRLAGGYSSLFKLTVTDNIITISLNSAMAEEARMHYSIVLVVIASNNVLKGYATIVINLPQSRSLSNIFKESIQKGKIQQDENIQILNMNDIQLVKEFNVADFRCKLTGDESTFLDYSLIVPKNVIKLILATELPNDLLQQRFYLSVLLECQSNEDSSIAGSTVVFIDLPGSFGQYVCSTPEPPTFIPEFQNEFYNFDAKPTYVGLLGSVHAIIRDSEDVVRYSLQVDNEHIKSKIHIDSISGEISLSGITSPGRYYFDIIAENDVTLSRRTAKGRLDIEALIQCEDHVSVSNSLLIKYLEEETNHDAILHMELGKCEFYVFSVEPNDRDYVKIDPSTKMLKMIPTDREESIFAEMSSPQIAVKLKLVCSDESARLDSENTFKRVERGLTHIGAENRSLILTDDIRFAKDVTMLSIMLVDINDNPPEFIFPRTERFVIGFPDGDISLCIFSEYIIKVIAADKDDGQNAIIRYSIQPNEHFKINPNNGEIYPYSNAMKALSEIDLIVYATDRNGARDGLSAKLTMVVKVLKPENFALLSFTNSNLTDVDTLLNLASQGTGLDLLAMKHATVSLADDISSESFRGSKGSLKFVQKIWAYAFDGDIPILSKDIKQKLSDVSNGVSISAQTFAEYQKQLGVDEISCIQNVTGYIVGLCVLALMIVTCIGYIFWIYILQKNPHDEPIKNLSTRGPINQNFNLKQGAEVNIQKQAELFGDPSMYETSFYSKRESVKIIGTTTQESTDDGRRRQLEKLNSCLNGSLDDGNESDSSNDSGKPRATVTFNELVERIHIESDEDVKRNS